MKKPTDVMNQNDRIEKKTQNYFLALVQFKIGSEWV